MDSAGDIVSIGVCPWMAGRGSSGRRKRKENNMNCLLCGKPITLVPSAAERAKKYGKTADHYDKLFTTHSECLTACWYGRETKDMHDYRIKQAERKTT
jgi:uncharacterized protein with PIN domain